MIYLLDCDLREGPPPAEVLESVFPGALVDDSRHPHDPKLWNLLASGRDLLHLKPRHWVGQAGKFGTRQTVFTWFFARFGVVRLTLGAARPWNHRWCRPPVFDWNRWVEGRRPPGLLDQEWVRTMNETGASYLGPPRPKYLFLDPHPTLKRYAFPWDREWFSWFTGCLWDSGLPVRRTGYLRLHKAGATEALTKIFPDTWVLLRRDRGLPFWEIREVPHPRTWTEAYRTRLHRPEYLKRLRTLEVRR